MHDSSQKPPESCASKSMKRAFRLLPLLGLAPLGHFLGPYLDGAGLLPRGSGFFVGLASMLLLPWLIATLFLTVRAARLIRVLLFIAALMVQGILLFTLSSAPVISEMMGIAHRLRREFPPDQMQTCATSLRQKEHDGTLVVRQRDKDKYILMSEDAVLVDDSELPAPLRGRFKHVFIQSDPVGGEQRVYFSLDERSGIVCDSRKRVREFFVCSMADGVHAYRYQRL
jgi:hypothetical protein